MQYEPVTERLDTCWLLCSMCACLPGIADILYQKKELTLFVVENGPFRVSRINLILFTVKQTKIHMVKKGVNPIAKKGE